mgnify:CR=1 FL=1
MVKLDMESATKYLALAAGAVAIPAVVMGTGFAATLAGIPGFAVTLGNAAITVGGIVLASVGVGLVDQLFFGK